MARREMSASDLLDALNYPGHSFPVSPHHTRSISTSSLTDGQQQQPRQRPTGVEPAPLSLPQTVRYSADLVQQAFADISACLRDDPRTANLRPDVLLAAALFEQSLLDTAHLRHAEENDAIKMDELDFLRVVCFAVNQVLLARGDSRRVGYRRRANKPPLDLVIHVCGDESPAASLIAFEYKSYHLAQAGPQDFEDLVDLATQGQDLTCSMHTGTSDRQQEPSGALRTPGRAKALATLARMSLYMAKEDVLYGVLSCHERFIFFRLDSRSPLTLSRAHMATDISPSITGILFALALDSLELTDVGLKDHALLPSLTEEAVKKSDANDPSFASPAARGSTGVGHASSDTGAEPQTKDAKLYDASKFLTMLQPAASFRPQSQLARQADSVAHVQPDSSGMSITLIVDTSSLPWYQRPHCQASTVLRQYHWSQSSQDNELSTEAVRSPEADAATSVSSLDRSRTTSTSTTGTSVAASSESQVCLHLCAFVGEGSTANVYRIRGSTALVKIYEPFEGQRQTDQWKYDFETEARFYQQYSAGLEDCVPQFYGAYWAPNDEVALILLEDCGSALGQGLSFEDVSLAERRVKDSLLLILTRADDKARLAVYRLYIKFAQKAIVLGDAAARNTVRSADGRLRLIDFAHFWIEPLTSQNARQCLRENRGMLRLPQEEQDWLDEEAGIDIRVRPRSPRSVRSRLV